MKIIGYARVSTLDQNPALQLDALKAAGCERIYSDKASGADQARTGLVEALAALEAGDVLVIWKLDRVGRSLADLVKLMDDLGRRGIGLKSISEAIDLTTAAGRMLFGLVAVFAAFERDMIRERTSAGLAAAKRRGVRLGRRRKVTQDQASHAAQMVAKGDWTTAEAARHYRVGHNTMKRALAREGSSPKGTKPKGVRGAA